MNVPRLPGPPLRLPAAPGPPGEIWTTLCELAAVKPDGWTLIGGQMVLLHALEHDAEPSRVSTDLDILVNARIVAALWVTSSPSSRRSGSHWRENPLTGSLIATPAGTRSSTCWRPKASAPAPT